MNYFKILIAMVSLSQLVYPMEKYCCHITGDAITAIHKTTEDLRKGSRSKTTIVQKDRHTGVVNISCNTVFLARRRNGGVSVVEKALPDPLVVATLQEKIKAYEQI